MFESSGEPKMYDRGGNGVFFLFLNLVFISRYMQPEGLWQRLCRFP